MKINAVFFSVCVLMCLLTPRIQAAESLGDPFAGNELQNKTLGVVGLGKIGREVIKRSLSYDMNILGFDPFVSQDSFDENEVKVVTIDELTQSSDYITLHVPINDATRNLFDSGRISMMKKTSKIRITRV